ncbi:leucine-rich repeat extensin-like protein 3 [Quercus lobata]|uniref:leucine-rich repeat extensin-like protein 3 n=1 Tax=Quercus lobata TaxID=97700 RepID=UPI001247D059|nr:leucine-rich repeat extensin-like protein 3 [Quercus lobata]
MPLLPPQEPLFSFSPPIISTPPAPDAGVNQPLPPELILPPPLPDLPPDGFTLAPPQFPTLPPQDPFFSFSPPIISTPTVPETFLPPPLVDPDVPQEPLPFWSTPPAPDMVFDEPVQPLMSPPLPFLSPFQLPP